jgi:hypothetical protein
MAESSADTNNSEHHTIEKDVDIRDNSPLTGILHQAQVLDCALTVYQQANRFVVDDFPSLGQNPYPFFEAIQVTTRDFLVNAVETLDKLKSSIESCDIGLADEENSRGAQSDGITPSTPPQVTGITIPESDRKIIHEALEHGHIGIIKGALPQDEEERLGSALDRLRVFLSCPAEGYTELLNPNLVEFKTLPDSLQDSILSTPFVYSEMLKRKISWIQGIMWADPPEDPLKYRSHLHALAEMCIHGTYSALLSVSHLQVALLGCNDRVEMMERAIDDPEYRSISANVKGRMGKKNADGDCLAGTKGGVA